MMKEEIQKLYAVYNALDKVEVKGAANVLNLGASMQILQEVIKELETAEQ